MASLRHHYRTLESRIEYLEKLVRRRPRNGFEAAELAMLLVARALFRRALEEQTGNAYTTSFLLEEAASHLERESPTLRVEELVLALRERARLLDAVSEHGPPAGPEGRPI